MRCAYVNPNLLEANTTSKSSPDFERSAAGSGYSLFRHQCESVPKLYPQSAGGRGIAFEHSAGRAEQSAALGYSCINKLAHSVNHIEIFFYHYFVF